MDKLSHPYMTVGKTIALNIWTFVSKVMSLLFKTLSRIVIAFLPRSKCLWISSLQSPSTVILEPKKVKSVTVSTFSPSICHEVMGLDALIFIYWMLSFKPAFQLSSLAIIKRLFSSSSRSVSRVVSYNMCSKDGGNLLNTPIDPIHQDYCFWKTLVVTSLRGSSQWCIFLVGIPFPYWISAGLCDK